jgi:hypothetical protein
MHHMLMELQVVALSSEYSPVEHLNVDSNDLPIRSRQEMVFSDEYKPVGKPIKKAGAELQASGTYSYSHANL